MRRFLAVLLCGVLLFSMVGCGDTPEAPKTYEEQKALYGDIIARYTSLLADKHSGKELTAPNTEGMDERQAAIAEALYGIVNVCADGEAAEKLGYGYKDLDGNGVPELILLTQHTIVRAIFTLSDEKPLLLEAAYGKDNYCYFAARNRFLLSRNVMGEELAESTYYTCRVDGDKMVYDKIYGTVYDLEEKDIVERFKLTDGQRTSIDKDTFNKLHWEHNQTLGPGSGDVFKYMAPRIHLPLAEAVSDEGLPVADFSDYEAILETYKAISGCLKDFQTLEWAKGSYDNLFVFPDDRSFEYYSRLLYAAYHGGSRMGYDAIDLNGDGRDELVLLNPNYDINAIFTMKKEKPELLYAAFDSETCWLDEEGLIHVDREEYYELEYSLYRFTKEGDFSQVYSLLLDGSGTRFLIQNRKAQEISFEKSMELYGDYCRYAEPFETTEQTRMVSKLTFTPLFEETKDPAVGAMEKTWYKSADLEKTTGKELANGCTYLSFENLSDTQVKVNFKYTFTYFYPDPDRENYMKEDVTESFLEVTGDMENSVLRFEGSGVMGRIEFFPGYTWLIVEESTDVRFPVGYHCCTEYIPRD